MENLSLTIRPIPYASENYHEELLLRDRVLRKPLGMNLFDESLDNELYDYHLGAFSNNTLIGVLILTELNQLEVKMRQVAVDDMRRGKKTGTKMVVFAEDYCFKKGYKRIVLNARKTAVNFYLKQGYKIVGNEFMEINLPHYKMIKELK